MKIVQLSTYFHGGAGIAALRLHQSLMKEPGIQTSFVQKFPVEKQEIGINNRIYTCEPDMSAFNKIVRKIGLVRENLNWHELTWHRRIGQRFHNHPINYEILTFPKTSYRLEKLPVIQEADIIHLHWVSDFLNYPTFFRQVKQPIVWTLHDMNPFMGLFHYEGDVKNNPAFKTLDDRILNLKRKAIHKNKDIHVVCLSEWMKEKSLMSKTFSNYPHYIIPNGLDFHKFPAQDRQKAKEETGVNNGQKTLLFVAGGLNHRKGFDLIIAALNKRKETNYNLISVGEGDTKFHKQVNHIHYNKVTDINFLNKLYTAADIVIIPSREDNLPNVMLESFMNGTPVMSFANGGMAEHVRTGENGILINEINSDSLRKSIDDFLDDTYVFDRVKIREYAIETFSDKVQTQKYIQLYQNILNKISDNRTNERKELSKNNDSHP